jgi:cytochrome c5
MKINQIISTAVLSFLTFAALQLASCTYENEAELYGPVNCDTSAVKYSTVVQPLLKQNCNGCHSVTSSVTNKPMDTYAALKPYIENGSFGYSIRGTNGYDIMPQSGPMSNCNLEKIEAWINAGFPNN